MIAEAIHVPVLLAEVIEQLRPQSGCIYVDGNLGLGGHSGAILEHSSPDGQVIGFDWDEKALVVARERLKKYGDRIHFAQNNFADIAEVLSDLEISEVDGILLDLGLSSLQLEVGQRGFSFKGSEPLDMRMDSRKRETAADLVNTASEEELADIFYYFGEERQARRIASAISADRVKKPFQTTDQLAGLVERVIPRRFHPRNIHVATKVFQGLRIAVNRELDNLARILDIGSEFLKKGGKFCVISFHSLEDRMVKRAFLEDDKLRIVTRKPVGPTESESRNNPRARSAKLRVSERV